MNDTEALKERGMWGKEKACEQVKRGRLSL